MITNKKSKVIIIKKQLQGIQKELKEAIECINSAKKRIEKLLTQIKSRREEK